MLVRVRRWKVDSRTEVAQQKRLMRVDENVLQLDITVQNGLRTTKVTCTERSANIGEDA